MKRLFIVIALIVSSFFLFGEDVSAYSHNVELSFDLINEDFFNFKNKIEEFIESDTTYSDNFFIIKKLGTTNEFQAGILPKDDEFSPYCQVFSSKVNCAHSTSNVTAPFLVSGSLSFNQTLSKNKDVFSSSSYNPIIYSNFNYLIKMDSSQSTITYSYNDFVKIDIADGTDNLSTLYDIYLEYQLSIGGGSNHDEELETISNFYFVVIDKLSYLAEKIVENYILLAIIVIFILIFVFKLIFRRYL